MYLVILFILLFKFGLSANILFVDELLAPSHQMWNYRITEELLNRGHNVTLIGPRTIQPLKEHKNYTWFELSEIHLSVEKYNLLDPKETQNTGAIGNIKLLFDYGIYTCQDTLKSSVIKKLLDYPSDFKFDLIIFDVSISGCLYPLIPRFNYPASIGVTAFLLPLYLSNNFGNNLNPAFTPHMCSQLSDKMTFTERIQNFIYFNIDKLLKINYIGSNLNREFKKYFGEDTEDWQEIEKHFSLLLANIIPGFHHPHPLTPNIIPVGGLHIKPSKTLPKDLQEIVDNSKGVILFSLGTLVSTSQLEKYKVKMIVDQLARLNETVLWKLDNDLENLPENVFIRKWLPQSDILAHPKTKLFISHGGGLSTIETIYYGVPIITIPFIVDQHSNGILMEKHNVGKLINFKSITGEQLFGAIQELLHNPKYARNAKKLSALMKDQPDTPLERAIFWIEWSIRHNGTHYLNPASRELPFYVTLNLDIYLFFVGMLIIVLFFLQKTILFLISYTFQNNESFVKELKKNK